MNSPIFGLVGTCMAMLMYLLFEVADLKKRLADFDRLGAKLDLLPSHQGLTDDPTAGLPAELMRAGKKIAAIKAYRETTGANLPDAKAFAESIPLAPKPLA